MKFCADDCLIYMPVSCTDDQLELNKCLEDLELWCCEWDMQVNFKKTTYVHITNKKNVLNFQYNIGSNKLSKTPHFKYLGVTITNNLTWHRHIESVCFESFKKLCFLRAKMHKSPKHIKLLAYHTYIRPRLQYASVVWSPHQKHLVTKLERIQRREALIWVPAHSGHPGNETAHQRARGFVDRAVGHSESDALVPEPLVTYHDITQHYRLERYFYSHPHSSLPKRSEIAWRRLQTRTFPCPLVFSYMHPGAIDPRCCLCGNVASLNHILWGCPEDPPPADLLCSPPTEGQWEALLSSNDIDIQTRVLKRAEEVIEKHSLAAFVA
ncbi:uncharacterized protein LOC142784965 isoform X1 [Rhipicephalus microplus]|uniref:uncharacterized protein LOC142784965 isoform X1 n=1 Tax=Rhipicephalus microplus TaxID=6941 RepID=UPI003F6B8BB2